MKLLKLILISSFFSAGTIRDTTAETNQSNEAGSDTPAISLGKQIVEKKKCTICHSLDGKGGVKTMKPMNGITEGRTDEFLRGSLLRPKEVIDPKTKMPAYKLDENELKAVIEYLKTLKPLEAPKS